jgi:uncharacterized repeat protein (TIGR01451 family)
VTKAVLNSTLTLVGNDPTLDVFNVTAAQWATAARSITAPPGATVLINVAGQTQDFLGSMNLSGTDAGHVLMNFYQATTFTGHNMFFAGTVLAPLASATLDNDTVNGAGIFGGNVSQQNVGFNNTPFLGMLPDVTPPTVNIATTPNPTAVTLDPNPVILKDSATISGGNSPTGTITFTLFYKGGGTPVDTEKVAVNGNGTYTTSTGLTLPSTGAVTGTYQWDAAYSGDANNSAASDNNDPAERVTVSAASPTLSTTPNPAAVTLGATTPPLLTDSVILGGGFHPTGTITFTLLAPGGGAVGTETVTVSGNGTYTTPTGFTLPAAGTVTGTYQWEASYSGDANNSAAIDQGGPTEQTVVSPASPTLTTTPNPTAVTLSATASTTLTDTANLAGGYHPTAKITFTLTGPNGFSFTQTDTVGGNGAYAASATLPTTGVVAGVYQWVAVYGGDGNNVGVSDGNPTQEQVEVIPARPTLTTTPSPIAVTLPAAGPTVLADTATLSGGFAPTGDITFELFQGSTLVHAETVAVGGNGAYPTPTGFTLPTTGTVAGVYQWVAVYSGDANNVTVIDGNPAGEQVQVIPANPTLVTTASPTTVTLPAPVPIMLTDTADLEGGFDPTGSVVFTLTGPGGFSFTRTDAVSGDGTYTASATLPTAGMVAGTYTWTAYYTGDANNKSADDEGGPAEQTVVSPAGPTLTTTASPPVSRGAAAPTLSDTAVLSGGFDPTGSIVFTLTGPGGFSFTQTDAVSGDGTYTASAPLPTTGAVAGVYTWTAHYTGDANNNAANDQGGTAEQVTVPPASPTLTTTASPAVTLGTTAPTLSDTALLSGGLNPVGAITFTLSGPAGFSFTKDVTVNGNGTYTASTTQPTSGTVAGLYTWTAAYGGDANNAAGIDQGGAAEQTVVSAASPTIATTPDPSTAALGGTLQDAANLEGGYFPAGSITFRLYAPGVDPAAGPAAYTETVAVSGDGAYHTAAGFAANAGGTWHWVAAYSGDANNGPASGGPLDEPVTVAPAQADLALVKQASTTEALVGSAVTYTFILHNNGPGAAANVVVADPFSGGVALVGPFTASQGTFDPAAGVWNVGTLPSGATATLTAVGQVLTLGPVVNTATAHADQFDPNLSNNSDTAAVTGLRPAAMVTKRLFLSESGSQPRRPRPRPPRLRGSAVLRRHQLRSRSTWPTGRARMGRPSRYRCRSSARASADA